MSDFTIERVNGMREWTGDHGTFHIFEVEFTGAQGAGTAEIKRKDSSPAPVAGETIDAEIIRKGDRTELKRIYKPGGGSSSNGGGGRGKPGEFRSPEQIIRGYAHMNALNYWELKHAADPTFQFASWGDYTAIVQLFYDDIKGAV